MGESGDVRVRFCPSPTGNPHVGLVRTALYNWAHARRHGGVFVFRIEDTDAARDSEESYRALLQVMRWLGLDWDEGPEVGGPYGPYRQSERGAVYADAISRLTVGGYLYHCYCTPEEVAARAAAAGRNPGYDNHCRRLSAAQVNRYRADGRAAVLRFRMPDRELSWTDLVRGPVRFAPEHLPDYVVVRASGQPLYPLVNPVDDALMRITDVLRGEDLLPSTPRQLALYEALTAVGLAEGTPRFGHLPYVMGEGNKKLSKRDPTAAVLTYRTRGFLPEGLLNYLALLGWAISPDRDIFSVQEMAEHFDVAAVNANPARFDLKKCEAVNAAWIRRLDTEELAVRLVPYLADADLVADPPTAEQAALLSRSAPLVQERVVVLADAVEMLRFLFVAEEAFAPEPAAAGKALGPDAGPVLRAARTALADLPEWSAPEIELALKAALVDGLSLAPRRAFAPVRVAVTGRTVSPPLYESIELLGRDRTLGRLGRAAGLGGSPAVG